MVNQVTSEQLLEKVLAVIPSFLDKRPGSMIYTICSAVCYGFYKNVYLDLAWTLDQMFIKTCNTENLFRHGAQQGIYPFSATRSEIKGKFDKTVTHGHRFKHESTEITYIATEESDEIEGYHYTTLVCETKGKVGNVYEGRLIPLTPIPQLTLSEVDELTVAARDDETHDEFLERLEFKMQNEAYGWNPSQYKQELKKIDGVGQVMPVRYTAQTETDYNAKVYIVNNENKTPSAELIQAVSDYIVANAPSTHNTQVLGAVVVAPPISATITLDGSVAWNVVKSQAETQIESVIEKLKDRWSTSTQQKLRISEITVAILGIDGVDDVSDVKINDIAENYEIPQYNIIDKGIITLTQGV